MGQMHRLFLRQAIIHFYHLLREQCDCDIDQSTTATWVGYNGVWHLNGDLLDGSPAGVNGANTGSTDQTGLFANGRGFNGSAQIFHDQPVCYPKWTILNIIVVQTFIYIWRNSPFRFK